METNRDGAVLKKSEVFAHAHATSPKAPTSPTVSQPVRLHDDTQSASPCSGDAAARSGSGLAAHHAELPPAPVPARALAAGELVARARLGRVEVAVVAMGAPVLVLAERQVGVVRLLPLGALLLLQLPLLRPRLLLLPLAPA